MANWDKYISNPGRAAYYSPATDWLESYQRKTYGGRQTSPNSSVDNATVYGSRFTRKKKNHR